MTSIRIENDKSLLARLLFTVVRVFFGRHATVESITATPAERQARTNAAVEDYLNGKRTDYTPVGDINELRNTLGV